MEKGGPPYAADGSLDYAESASESLLYAIYPLVLSLAAQSKIRSVYFQPSFPTFLVPLSSPQSSLHLLKDHRK